MTTQSPQRANRGPAADPANGDSTLAAARVGSARGACNAGLRLDRVIWRSVIANRWLVAAGWATGYTGAGDAKASPGRRVARRVVFSSSGDPTRSVTEPSLRGRSFLFSLADGFLSVLFPSHCRCCQAPLTHVSRLPVCRVCLAGMRPIEGPRCAACGERLMSRHLHGDTREDVLRQAQDSPCATPGARATPPLCLMCLQNEPAFARASAYGSYDGGLRDLVHLLKYERVRPAANVLGRMLADVVAELAEAFGPQPPVVIAVPLHASKMRRGFDQSELIARAMLRLKPAALDAKLNTSALVRHRMTESQTGLTPPQRRENVRGAFKVERGDQISGRDILLIDDVFTTGATVSECARVLRRAGAERVFVATVTRVLKAEAERVEPEFEEPRIIAAHA